MTSCRCWSREIDWHSSSRTHQMNTIFIWRNELEKEKCQWKLVMMGRKRRPNPIILLSPVRFLEESGSNSYIENFSYLRFDVNCQTAVTLLLLTEQTTCCLWCYVSSASFLWLVWRVDERFECIRFNEWYEFHLCMPCTYQFQLVLWGRMHFKKI